ncbi:MAG: hypothetical protein ACOZCK_13530 [Pseudomonadota bacterium]
MSSDSEIFALIGRIHVLMRRSLNRITDVDYMKENKEYARAIVALAEGSGQEELAQLAGKLRQAMALDPAEPMAAAPEPKAKYLFTLR